MSKKHQIEKHEEIREMDIVRKKQQIEKHKPDMDADYVEAAVEGNIAVLTQLSKKSEELSLDYIEAANNIAMEQGKPGIIRITNLTLDKKKDTQKLKQDGIKAKSRVPPDPGKVFSIIKLAKSAVERKRDTMEIVMAPKNEKSDMSIDEVVSYNFGTRDILHIMRSSIMGEKPLTIKENILHVISQWVMLDYGSNNMEFVVNTQLLPSENKKIKLTILEKEIEIGKNDLDALLRKHKNVPKKKTPRILHPSDVAVIIMNCCDNFLRQIIVQKMTFCQLAFPLVLPNICDSEPLFLLWAMRLMTMNWKSQISGAHDINPVDYPTPIVSAVRLGDLSISKSKILNQILCDQSHNIFFHRDCEGGNIPRIFSKDVVELAWYLPGGRKGDKFDTVMAFLNLRADAKYHSKEFELLLKVSSIILLFISSKSISDHKCSERIKNLYSSHQKFVNIILGHISEDNLRDFKKLVGTNICKVVLEYESDGHVKNASSLANEIRNEIAESLGRNPGTENVTKQNNWEMVSGIARDLGIKVDEDITSCQLGKNMANVIIDELQSNNVRTIKEHVLPLQGKLWSEWSKLTKKASKTGWHFFKRSGSLYFRALQQEKSNSKEAV